MSMDKYINLEFLYQRNKLIWGDNTQKLLWDKHVMIFGLGGVGSYVVEALARSGIGTLSLVDFDRVAISNFNRQIIATIDNLNLPKTEAMQKRIQNINPEITIFTYPFFYDSSKNDIIFNQHVDYVVDAIDSVNAKLDLIEYCLVNKINIISSMGAGNRLDPLSLYITDISETKGNSCPLLKKVRLYLKKRGITKGLTILTSKEIPVKPDYSGFDNIEGTKDHPPGSTPFVPPVAGFSLAGYVIRKLIVSLTSSK